MQIIILITYSTINKFKSFYAHCDKYNFGNNFNKLYLINSKIILHVLFKLPNEFR